MGLGQSILNISLRFVFFAINNKIISKMYTFVYDVFVFSLMAISFSLPLGLLESHLGDSGDDKWLHHFGCRSVFST